MKRDYWMLILGALIIAIGVILVGNNLGFWSIDLVFDGWWTLFIIIPGLVSIVNKGFTFGAAVLILSGVILLLESQGILDKIDMWKLVISSGLIVFGLANIITFFREG